MTLTFESVDQILWCDHSNKSSLPVLLHGAICFSKFHKIKFGNLVEICFWLNLAVKGLICLYGIFADQVFFIDPKFWGIFVCSSLQSFVVNIRVNI